MPLNEFRLYQTHPILREITGELQNWVPNELFKGQIIFTRHNNILYVSHFKSGVNFWAAVNNIGGTYYMDYEVKVPKIYKLKTRGLMGNLDGNSGNDFFQRIYAVPNIRESVDDLIQISNSFTDQQLSAPLLSCKQT